MKSHFTIIVSFQINTTLESESTRESRTTYIHSKQILPISFRSTQTNKFVFKRNEIFKFHNSKFQSFNYYYMRSDTRTCGHMHMRSVMAFVRRPTHSMLKSRSSMTHYFARLVFFQHCRHRN